MSITRKFLKGMGLTDEQQETILEAHTETVDEIKAERDRLKEDAGKLAEIQKQLDKAQTDLKAAQKDGWKEKHDKIKAEFDSYKADVTAKESKAEKQSAARAYYESKNITGKALEIAMRGSTAEIEALELEEGKIKDTSTLDALVSGDFSGLVGQTTIKGANTAKPPANTVGKSKMTKEEIMNIKDAGERQKAMSENLDLFGI